MGQLAGVFVLSFVVERIAEVLGLLFSRAVRRKLLPAVGLAVGLALSFGARIGLFDSLGLSGTENDGLSSWIDYLLTGVIIGAGSRPVHSLILALEHKEKELRGRVEKG
ncbi:MAG: hypothetical protein QME66_12480 [Candidatus Eisenbacteria bacterium]|nr:hypothetical protein [Candidatus Eisenbacteria bacterium]